MPIVENDNYRAWTTQRMANNLPPNTKFRKNPYSIGQQLTNVVGQHIDGLHRAVVDTNRNTYIRTANLDELDIAYEVELPNNQKFDIDTNQSLAGVPVFPGLTGVIDSTDITIETFSSNTIEDVWVKAFPTRAELDGEEIEIENVLDPTPLAELPQASLTEGPVIIGETIIRPQLPRKLKLTISGADSFGFITKENFSPGYIRLFGETRKGKREEEVVIFHKNGFQITKKEWKKVDKITAGNIYNNQVATLQIELFDFNSEFVRDPYSIHIDLEKQQKSVDYKLELEELPSTEVISILDSHVIIANNLGDLLNGVSGTNVVQRVELRNSAGTALSSLVDIAIKPFTRRLYALGTVLGSVGTESKLYVYDLNYPLAEADRLGQGTPSPIVVIEPDTDILLREETLTLVVKRQRAKDSILKTRVKVEKPDGSSAYISVGGAEVSANSAWYINPFSSSIRYDNINYSFLLEESGTYIFEVEALTRDSGFQTDRKLVYAITNDAKVEFDLSTTLINPQALTFDSNQDLWILDEVTNSTGSSQIAKKVNLFYDYALIDFLEDKVLCREQYDFVKVSI